MSDFRKNMEERFTKLENIPIEIIREFHEFINMSECSKTSSMEDIVNNVQLPWNYYIISQREDIDLHQLTKLHKICPGQKWDRKKATLATFCFNGIRCPYVDKDTIKHIIQYSSPEYMTDIIKKNTTKIETLENIDQIKTIITEKYRYSNESIIQNAISNISNFLYFDLLTHFVSWECIACNPNHPWILYDKKISFNIEDKHYCPYSYLYILQKKNINWSYLTKYENFYTILQTQDLPWDMQEIYEIIRERDIDGKYIMDFIKLTPKLPWDMKILTDIISWEWIDMCPYLDWDIQTLTYKNITRTDLPSSHLIMILQDHLPMQHITRLYPIKEIAHSIHNIRWDKDILLGLQNVPFQIFLHYPMWPWVKSRVLCSNDFQKKKFQEKVDIDNTPLPTDIQGILYEFIF